MSTASITHHRPTSFVAAGAAVAALAAGGVALSIANQDHGSPTTPPPAQVHDTGSQTHHHQPPIRGGHVGTGL